MDVFDAAVWLVTENGLLMFAMWTSASCVLTHSDDC